MALIVQCNWLSHFETITTVCFCLVAAWTIVRIDALFTCPKGPRHHIHSIIIILSEQRPPDFRDCSFLLKASITDGVLTVTTMLSADDDDDSESGQCDDDDEGPFCQIIIHMRVVIIIIIIIIIIVVSGGSKHDNVVHKPGGTFLAGSLNILKGTQKNLKVPRTNCLKRMDHHLHVFIESCRFPLPNDV
eukprot:6372790-Amphidinium_carterae.2